METGIHVRVETKGSSLNINERKRSFWLYLSKGIRAQCRGEAGKWLMRNYVSEISVDEHEELEAGFTIWFNNPGGMCDASAGVTLHMARLILAHNADKFEKNFKRSGTAFLTSFGTIKELQAEAESLYFDHDGKVYGISLPVVDFSKIDDHLISDSGFAIAFEELPPSKQKQLKSMVEDRICHCFVCRKIANHTFKHIIF